jgi:hypothetical protein
MGERTTYTPEIGRQICRWIAEGGTLREWCRQEDSPCFQTVYRWIDENVDFAVAMDRARDLGADAIAMEALKIADTPQYGTVTTLDGDKVTTRNEDMLGHRKLQVETRLKLLAKWHPKKYGDKFTQEHVGKDGGPIQTEELSDFEKARRVAFLLARGIQTQTESQPGESGNPPQTTL